MKNTKGQEEIVGFVAIVLIVSVILIIFLAVSASNKPSLTKQSQDVQIFLDSAMTYTSDCAISYEPAYSSVQDLIKECENGQQCLSGNSACQTLNETILNMLESSWPVGSDRPIKGYAFDAWHRINVSSGDNQKKDILPINTGNCSSGNYIGSQGFFSDYPGDIIYSLKLCY